MSPEKKWSKLDTLIAFVGVIVASIAFFSVFDCYYDINDDVLMKDILCGAYTGTPSGYNIQMLYPVSAFISLLYRIAPQWPCYGIFLTGCHILCVFLFMKRMSGATRHFWKKIAFCIITVVMFITLFLWELVYIQYTATSGLLMATAAFWFYTAEYKESSYKFLRENIIGIVLVLLAYGIRTEMALLLFPFLGVIGLFRWIDAAYVERKKRRSIDGKKASVFICIFSSENRIKYMSIILSVFFGMFVMLLVDKIAYNSEEWRRFCGLFDDRTELYDYRGIAEYNGNEDMYETIGLTKEQHELLVNYNYILDESIDAGMFEKVKLVLTDGGRTSYLLDIKETTEGYFKHIFHKTDAPYIYFVWLGYLTVFITALISKRRAYFWRLPLLFVVRTLLWGYLIMHNRMPARVTHPLYLMELFILAAMLVSQIKKIHSDDKLRYRRFWPTTVLCVFGIVGFGACYESIYNTFEEQLRREKVNMEWQKLQDYCAQNEDALYMIDVYSTVAYSEPMFKDVDNHLKNYIYAGGWACKSPIEAQKLQRYNVSKPGEDLASRSDIFFITYADKDITWLKQLYNSKGKRAVIWAVGRISVTNGRDFCVYRIYAVPSATNSIVLTNQ